MSVWWEEEEEGVSGIARATMGREAEGTGRVGWGRGRHRRICRDRGPSCSREGRCEMKGECRRGRFWRHGRGGRRSEASLWKAEGSASRL